MHASYVSERIQAHGKFQNRPPTCMDVRTVPVGSAKRDFYERPKATRPRLARQVLVWLWVKRSRGTQTQLARYLSVGGDQVSRWFGRAVDEYEQLEPFIERVEELLPRDEPLLASGDPDRITVNVEIIND